MPYDYGKKKLYEAVHSLVGNGSIQERLTFAALPLVVLRTPLTELSVALPAELHEKFNATVDKLTENPLSGEAGYTPRHVTPEEGELLAQEIFSMFVRVMGGL
jgi:hypothetical protein